jgi:hypothetical protein
MQWLIMSPSNATQPAPDATNTISTGAATAEKTPDSRLSFSQTTALAQQDEDLSAEI